MTKRYEVWFQYNKTGNWRFTTLIQAKKFAKKFKDNRPVIYDLKKDKPINLR